MSRAVRTARRAGRLGKFAIHALWAVPAVLVIRVVRPWRHVRLAALEPHRIGHFVADAAILLARRSLEPPAARTRDLFWLPKATSNEQWARMVRRHMVVRPWVRYLFKFNKLIPGGAPHELALPSWSGNRAAYAPLRASTSRFTFTPDENQKARAWLQRRGWRDGEKFVCLQARDSAYLATHPLHSQMQKGHYDYHNYRDVDIDTFGGVARALVDRGYWVIRMGQIVQKHFPFEHDRVIDYPFVHDRDDLLDIWLSVHCSLFVSTGTGIDVIPWVYGKPPVVFVNALPLFMVASQISHVWVPKHLRWKTSGKLLTLSEHCAHRYSVGSDYERAGILIEDLAADEITAAVLEGEQRSTGGWRETHTDRDLQRRAWEILRHCPDFLNFHESIHPDARFGCAWLKSMGDEFLA
jgi:putative glycosyltransferase (TIGR04372 family)